MTMNYSTLQELLDAKEGENVEFKRAEKNYDFEKLVKYACAIANCGGGQVVFGITDKRPRQVVGSAVFEQPERTRKGLMERLGIGVDFQLFMEDGKRVLVFNIPSRPVGLPVQDRGKDKGMFWWRDGDSLIPMPAEEMRTIFAEIGHDFSSDVCPNATLVDLDESAIQAFRDRVAQKSGRQDLAVYSHEQILADYGALTAVGVTYAALVLFGKSQSLDRLLSQCEVIFEYRSTEASGSAQQRVEFRRGFFSFYDKLWELINLRNDLQHYQSGLFIEDVPTFDERTVREAIMNAVCHRDYQLAGSVFIIQYPRKLIIKSPGGFPQGITPENILNRQSARNRLIAELLARCGLVERAGQGMNLMFEQSIRQAKSLPDFHDTDRYQVQLTLDGLVQDPALLVMMERIGKETLQTFGTEDFLLVNRIRQDQTVPDALRSRVARLVELGVIEKASRGRYMLSRRFYTETGKKGVYTRKRGLEPEENKALLLKHIRNNRLDGSQLAELCQVLPSRTRRQVQNLLQDLQRAGLVVVSGKTRAGRWFPASE